MVESVPDVPACDGCCREFDILGELWGELIVVREVNSLARVERERLGMCPDCGRAFEGAAV